MTEAAIDVMREGPIGILILNKPKTGNCLSMAVWAAIATALQEMEADGTTRAILVRAQGKHFCTGADLTEVKHVRTNTAALEHFLASGHDALCAIEASPLPVVVAVQGLCLAGGLELVLACDVAFAASGARFGDQHTQFGLLPGWGGSQRLTRTIGLRRAHRHVPVGALDRGGRGGALGPCQYRRVRRGAAG